MELWSGGAVELWSCGAVELWSAWSGGAVEAVEAVSVEPEIAAELEAEVFEEAAYEGEPEEAVLADAVETEAVVDEEGFAVEDEGLEAEVEAVEFSDVDLSMTQSVAVVADLQPSVLPEVPIQELTAPEPAELAYEEVEPAVDLAFIPNEQLELTRNHLAVLDPSGMEVDADQFEEVFADVEESAGEGLLVAAPSQLPDIAEKKNNKDKLVAILVTIGAHLLIFFSHWSGYCGRAKDASARDRRLARSSDQR